MSRKKRGPAPQHLEASTIAILETITHRNTCCLLPSIPIGQNVSEERLDFADCISAVADGVFFFGGDLSDGFAKAGYEENGVVAEAVAAGGTLGNHTFERALRFNQYFLWTCQTQTAYESRSSFFSRYVLQ